MKTVIAAAVFSFAAFTGCILGTGIGNTSGVCAAGQTCNCDIIGNCKWDCPGGGCKYDCGATGNCILSCAGGGCSATCHNTGNCILSCKGGGCTIACQGGINNCSLSDLPKGTPDGG